MSHNHKPQIVQLKSVLDKFRLATSKFEKHNRQRMSNDSVSVLEDIGGLQLLRDELEEIVETMHNNEEFS